MTVASYQVRLLGSFEFQRPGGEPLVLRSRKAAALIAYLARQPGRTQSRERIATLLWEDRPADLARASLRQVVFAIRHLTADGLLVDEPRRDSLRLAPWLATDVDRLEGALNSGETAGLVEAVELLRGDFLEGGGVHSDAFESWLLTERQRLRSLAMRAMQSLLETRRPARPEEQIAIALKALAFDPAEESIHRILMRLYAASGRRAEALRQYFRCRDTLWREFAVRPDPATDLLYRNLLEHRLTGS